uniref:Down syndrome cell adhesion molecule-like protein Dscam2 n=1 Tax=Strigamia maritima TaxID=126957 RepID=T1JAL9_STRMM
MVANLYGVLCIQQLSSANYICIPITRVELGVPLNRAAQLVTRSASYEDGPSFTLEPESTVDFSNDTGAQIGCSARGSPSPHVRWTVGDGSYVTDVLRIRRVLANGTLVFPQFGAEEYRQDVHAAVYKCTASNSVGTIVSRDVWVRAVVMQLYEVQVYDEFVITGNTGVLRCHIPSFVTDYVSVTSWFHDGVYGVAPGMAIENGHKFTILPTGELHIKDVTMNDGLTSFKCRTYHRLTKETRSSSTSGRLIVTAPQGSVPPRITDTKLVLQIRQGETLILPCAAQGHPPPSYSWLWKKKDGEMMVVREDGRVKNLGGSLIIQSGRIEDSGLYTCVVNNSIGSEKAETTLTVTAPLTARVDPIQQVVDLGRSSTLRCITSGHPVSSVKWLKDGKIIESMHLRTVSAETVQIFRLRREDMGMYQCVVKNNVETIHATAQIKIGDAAPELHRTFDPETIQPGSSVSLMCVASGNPQPVMSWTLDDGHLPGSGRIARGEQVGLKGEVVGFLNITYTKPEDGGDYKCVATNPAGKVEHSARLNVHGPPAIRPIRKISALAGGDSMIRCPYYGYPIDSVWWEKDSLKLPVNRRQRVFPNGTIIIQNVQPELDPGKYTCVIRNPQRLTARRDVEVVVVVPPVIAPFSFQGEQFVEGMRTRATCYVSKGDLPITILWLKDDHPMATSMGIAIRVIDEYSSILTIDNVTHAHSGNFTCVAQNSVAVANFTAKLIVNVSPRWLVEPRDTTVLIGHPVVLNCRAEGSPFPIITWMKAEGAIPGDYREIPSGNSRIVVAANGSLVMSSATETNDGEYMCQASNGVGAGLSRVVRLDVHVPPYFVEKNKNYTVKKGFDARMSCQVRGDTPIKITWFMNGSPVNRPGETSFHYGEKFELKDNGASSELVVRKAERNDNAVFSCVANNSYGSSEAFVYLTVQQVPESPRQFKVVQVKSRSADMSWLPPYDGNNPITRYIIQHKQIAESWDHSSPSLLSIVGKDNKASVVGLKPDHSYHFRIRAENSVGLGTPSEVLTITTQEEAPGGPPRHVQVAPVDSQTLKVTWKPPSTDVWFGEILGYNIGFRPQNATQPFTFRKMELQNEDETIYRFLVSGLKKFSRYVLVVQAFNRHGDGPSSEEVFAQTQEDVPSKPAQNLVCVSLSSQSVKLSWDVPPLAYTNGVLLGYKVVYRPLNSWYGNVQAKIKSTTESSYTLFELEPFTNYTIDVIPFTRIGDGTQPAAINCTTAEDVPDAPSDVKAVASSSDTILVSWKSPSYTKGVILKYTVYIRTVDGTKEETKKHVVPANQNTFIALGLRKNRRHEFWVTASTLIGEGQSTKVVAQSPAAKVGAKISSFDDTVVSRWKTNVTLPCKSVGVPAPEVEWFVRNQAVVVNERVKITFDGSLWIHEVLSPDAANYTCKVRNAYGTDAITYRVLVQAPPSPPSIIVTFTGLNSIHLQWDVTDVLVAPILGYSLSYRREYGEWEEMQLETDQRKFILDHLWCGTRYQLYMTAYSTVGPGKPSDIIGVKTKGSEPVAPVKEEVLIENTTSVTLFLDGWSGDDCSILYFIVEYRLKGTELWTLVSNHVKPAREKLPIGDLKPKNNYELRMTAHNNAGSTTALYDFTTRDVIIARGNPSSVITKEAKEKAFYSDVKIVIPLVASLVILAAAAVILCLMAKRKRESEHTAKREIAKTNPKYALVLERGLNMEHKNNLNNHNEVVSETPRKGNASSLCSRPTNFSDDVCPYATFQLASYSHQSQDEKDLPRVLTVDRADSAASLRMGDGTVAYAKAVKPKGRHQSQRIVADDRVPDLLYHSQESSSSNENSPDVKSVSHRNHLDGTYQRYSSISKHRNSSTYEDYDERSVMFRSQDMPPPYYPEISPVEDVGPDYYHYIKDLNFAINDANYLKSAAVKREQDHVPSQSSKGFAKDYTITV